MVRAGRRRGPGGGAAGLELVATAASGSGRRDTACGGSGGRHAGRHRGRAAIPAPAEWLGPGLVDVLGQRLDASSALHVYPSGSGQRLAALAPDPLQAARRLGVDYLVEGSIMRRGADIEVEVRLRTVADGATRWTQRFGTAAARVIAVPPDRGRPPAGGYPEGTTHIGGGTGKPLLRAP